MDDLQWSLAGVQLTLVGVLLVTFFEGTDPYPMVGLFLGVLGTVVVARALFAGAG